MLDLDAAFAAFSILATERLLLRAVTPDDAAAIYRIMSDPEVMRYFGSPPMNTIEEATRRVHSIEADFRERNGIRWAITIRATGQFVGTCGFWRLIVPHLRAEIGYELAREQWGQGIMPEALSAVLTFGFDVMRLHSVEAQIDPANHGSRRVLEKLGFVQEGYYRESYYDPDKERFTDTAVFSLLQAVWRNQAERTTTT